MVTFIFFLSQSIGAVSCADPKGGGGGGGVGQGVWIPPPPENHTNIGCLSNADPYPLKNHKSAKPAFNVGPSLARQ